MSDLEPGELSDGDCEMDAGADSDTSLVGSEPEYGSNPTGLFDALAAAQEAGERYRMLEGDGIDETCRLSDNFFVEAFKDAIR